MNRPMNIAAIDARLTELQRIDQRELTVWEAEEIMRLKERRAVRKSRLSYQIADCRAKLARLEGEQARA